MVGIRLNIRTRMGMGMACYWVEAERVNMGCCDIVI
jgi:hypothetical protein